MVCKRFIIICCLCNDCGISYGVWLCVGEIGLVTLCGSELKIVGEPSSANEWSWKQPGEFLTISAVARAAGAGRNTVKRHRDLFACWSSGSNRGVTGALVLSGGSCSGLEKTVSLLFDQADLRDLDCVQDSGSEELAPIDLTPPFLLPGYEPTSEPPASRPSPSGSFGSLDAGSRFAGIQAERQMVRGA